MYVHIYIHMPVQIDLSDCEFRVYIRVRIYKKTYILWGQWLSRSCGLELEAASGQKYITRP